MNYQKEFFEIKLISAIAFFFSLLLAVFTWL